MKYARVSEEEAQTLSQNLLPEGRCKFKVKDAEEKTSSNGNDMLSLKLKEKVTGKLIFDIIVLTPKWAWKLRHFADSCGLLEEYDAGTLSAAGIVGAEGEAEIYVEPANGPYKAKNAVRDYVKKADQASELPASLDTLDDDDIPF